METNFIDPSKLTNADRQRISLEVHADAWQKSIAQREADGDKNSRVLREEKAALKEIQDRLAVLAEEAKPKAPKK